MALDKVWRWRYNDLWIHGAKYHPREEIGLLGCAEKQEDEVASVDAKGVLVQTLRNLRSTLPEHGQVGPACLLAVANYTRSVDTNKWQPPDPRSLCCTQALPSTPAHSGSLYPFLATGPCLRPNPFLFLLFPLSVHGITLIFSELLN